MELRDIACLKRVQRKAFRFFSNNYHPIASVTNMLNEFEWCSLEAKEAAVGITLLYTK